MRLVCAWCLTVLREGDGPTSHGICEKCAKEVELGLQDTPSTTLEDSSMKMIKSKVYFGMRDDKTLLVVGVVNDTHNYMGDYYANEFYNLPDHFDPVGLTLAQLTNYLTAWALEKPSTLTHGNNADCPEVQRGEWARCLGHPIRNITTERTLDSDLHEDR